MFIETITQLLKLFIRVPGPHLAESHEHRIRLGILRRTHREKEVRYDTRPTRTGSVVAAHDEKIEVIAHSLKVFWFQFKPTGTYKLKVNTSSLIIPYNFVLLSESELKFVA